MNSAIWRSIDTLGLVISFALCFVGFWVMNWKVLIEHLATYPPTFQWYFGLVLFVFGIISFIILESGGKFNQGMCRFNIKIAFLITAGLMVLFSLGLYPPNHII